MTTEQEKQEPTENPGRIERERLSILSQLSAVLQIAAGQIGDFQKLFVYLLSDELAAERLMADEARTLADLATRCGHLSQDIDAVVDEVFIPAGDAIVSTETETEIEGNKGAQP